MPKTFSTEQLTQIADIVGQVIGETITPDPPVVPPETKTTYADPYIKSCLDAKAKIMDSIASTGRVDTVFVRGSRGITEVNRTKEALNMIDDQIADWKDRKTHRKMQ